MFAYCLNNPANYVDRDGTNAEALQLWAAGMGWLPFADAILPVGDIIYISGLLLLSAIALSSEQDCVPEISYDVSDVAYGPPSPDNDDDGDDDYYDDDDFMDDEMIYDEIIQLEFKYFIRNEISFGSKEELMSQITNDISTIRNKLKTN